RHRGEVEQRRNLGIGGELVEGRDFVPHLSPPFKGGAGVGARESLIRECGANAIQIGKRLERSTPDLIRGSRAPARSTRSTASRDSLPWRPPRGNYIPDVGTII